MAYLLRAILFKVEDAFLFPFLRLEVRSKLSSCSFEAILT